MKFVSITSTKDYGFGPSARTPGGIEYAHRYYCRGLHALGDDGQVYASVIDFKDDRRKWVPIIEDCAP